MKSIVKRLVAGAFSRAGYSLLKNETLAALQAGSFKSAEIRPLFQIDPKEREAAFPIGPDVFASELKDPAFQNAILPYFSRYPQRSMMSTTSRAVLFLLIRMMKPEVVIEIGTFYCGTTEVMARALVENKKGIIHTTDPFGDRRCQEIISTWPQQLQNITIFHAFNSMQFAPALESGLFKAELVLIDGNHDFEFALFDLQMMARQILKPGGIIVMDNIEQVGPFQAARAFMAMNPGWREIGNALASYDPLKPCEPHPSSVPDTNFLILQAPMGSNRLGPVPRSWGQVPITSNRVDQITLKCRSHHGAGTVHYQIILRSFAGSIIEEHRQSGWRNVAEGSRVITIDLDEPLISNLGVKFPDNTYTTEIEIAWIGQSADEMLALSSPPRCIALASERPLDVADDADFSRPTVRN